MLKKLNDVHNNKDGFTMVELIVVIAIILILAAVLIPNLFQYINKAAEASCKNDAVNAMTQVQADVADAYATAIAEGKEPIYTNIKIGGVTFEFKKEATNTIFWNNKTKGGKYSVDNAGQLSAFAYCNGSHFINWLNVTGWKKVDKY